MSKLAPISLLFAFLGWFPFRLALSRAQVPFQVKVTVVRDDGAVIHQPKVFLVTERSSRLSWRVSTSETSFNPARQRISKEPVLEGGKQVRATGAGIFDIENSANAYAIAVISSEGYAFAHSTQEPQRMIKLERWGSVEGELIIDGKQAGPGEIVSLAGALTDSANEFHLVYGDAVKTDAQGRFVFPNVPAGDIELAHTIVQQKGPTTSHIEHRDNQISTVRPGTKTNAVVGRGSRTVIVTFKRQNLAVGDYSARLQWLRLRRLMNTPVFVAGKSELRADKVPAGEYVLEVFRLREAINEERKFDLRFRTSVTVPIGVEQNQEPLVVVIDAE